LGYTAFANGYDGEFGAGKKAVQYDRDCNNYYFNENGIHVTSINTTFSLLKGLMSTVTSAGICFNRVMARKICKKVPAVIGGAT
jgi:hypothetical protein